MIYLHQNLGAWVWVISDIKMCHRALELQSHTVLCSFVFQWRNVKLYVKLFSSFFFFFRFHSIIALLSLFHFLFWAALFFPDLHLGYFKLSPLENYEHGMILGQDFLYSFCFVSLCASPQGKFTFLIIHKSRIEFQTNLYFFLSLYKWGGGRKIETFFLSHQVKDRMLW